MAGSIAISPPTHRFLSALDTQARVLAAMVLRSIVAEVSGRRVNILLIFLRPTIMVSASYLLMSFTNALLPQGMSLLAFLATGWLGWFAFHRTFAVLSGRGGGSLLLFPQVSPLDTYITNFIYQWLVYSIVFIAFVAAALLFERSPPPSEPLKVIVAFWTIQALGSCLALVFNSVGRLLPIVLEFNVIIRRGGVLISGVVVTAADTPNSLLRYLQWNPIFHCFEMMREAWWPAYVSPIANPQYVMTFIFYALALGLALERFTRRFLEA